MTEQLRLDRGWSQDELAFHAKIDGRQVSRYENGRVTPSIDVVVKMAAACNVSLDCLLLDEAPRRPLTMPKSRLVECLGSLPSLSDEDGRSLLHFLDAIEAKNKLNEVAAAIK